MKTIEQVITETPNATDAEILAAVEASRAWRRVPVAEVKLWLLNNNLLGALYVVRDTTGDTTVRAGLSELLAGIDIFESLDATDATIRTKSLTLAGGLQLAGVITSDQSAQFTSMLKEPMTVTQGDIDRYRRSVAIASHVAAAAEVAANVNTFNANAQAWIETGTGTMPEWAE